MWKALFRQRPADTVTIIFLMFLLALVLFYFQKIQRAPFLMLLYCLLLISQLMAIRFREKSRGTIVFHDLVFPVVCVLLVFDSLEWVVHSINPEDIDPLLIQLDYLVFGNHPTVILEHIMSPLLTDMLQVAYSTYYFIPLIFGITLLIEGQKENFSRSLFLILFCFYLSYLGYILMPAIGPRFTLDHLQTSELKGMFIAEPLQKLLNYLEGNKRDAFPSGHTAVAVTVLYLAYRFKKNLFLVFLPVVSALVFATVYCRYHYVVDILAGLILTFITVLAGERYYEWWRKWLMKRK
jgi:membrane-associated phospholipid phosphatase